MFVKICGITNAQDALLSVALGADALGFVFASSPRQVTVDQVRSIHSQIPSSVMTFGVFLGERPEKIVEITHTLGLSGAQIHGNYLPEQIDHISERVMYTVRAIVAGRERLERVKSYSAWAVLVDSPSPGSGQVFDWSLVEAVPERTKMIVAGGLTPENVKEAISVLRPFGVDVSSGVELEPGKKDPMKLRKFIAQARSSDDIDSDDLDVRSRKDAVSDDEDVVPYNWEIGR
jgi:phosphoribosylanthranilate isomerase